MQADTSHGEYETYLADLQEKFKEISKEEVLKRVAALEFNHFLKYYKNAEDLNARNDFRDRRPDTNNRDMGGRRERGTFTGRDNGYARLFINLGTKDGFYKASFLQFILDESNLSKDILGKIDIREMNAWVEIDKSAAGKMIKAIDGKTHNGRQIRMNEADGGFKRPNDEGGGRKRIPLREKRY
jgi:ATP-dependent RNA helicase DeaD